MERFFYSFRLFCGILWGKGIVDQLIIVMVAEYRWEGSKQLLRFDYKTSGRIIIGGTYHLQPEGTGARLSFEATVEVTIPVFVRIIARRIKKEMQRSLDVMVSLMG